MAFRRPAHARMGFAGPEIKKASGFPEAFIMAGSTRLELATFGVTGRRSNQLNYDPAQILLGSIRGTWVPAARKTIQRSFLVGGTRLELVTLGL